MISQAVLRPSFVPLGACFAILIGIDHVRHLVYDLIWLHIRRKDKETSQWEWKVKHYVNEFLCTKGLMHGNS